MTFSVKTDGMQGKKRRNHWLIPSIFNAADRCFGKNAAVQEILNRL